MPKKNSYRWGRFDFSKPFPKNCKIMLILGVICLIGSFALSAVEVLSGDSFSDSMSIVVGFMGLYGIAGPLAAFVSFCVWNVGHAAYLRHAEKEAAKEAEIQLFNEQHPHYEQEKFYQLCKENGITDIETPAAVARMVLLAKNNGIPGSERNLIADFKLGQAEVARIECIEKLAELQLEEMMLEEDNLRYKEAKDQQKRIMMCQEKAQHYRQEEKSYWAQSRATQDTIIRGTMGAMQKETDWATHGGIASGIAGPAAGLAVAADIQRKNADIREHNAALRQLSVKAALEASRETDSLASKVSREAEKWEERATAAENKLVQILPEEQLLELLSPTGRAYNSDTGAILVNIHISAARDLKIYETVSAVVDGCLKVQIMDGAEIVGTTYLTLPWNGSEFSADLEGVCRNPIKQANKYTVKIEPHHLWAIEK